MPNVEIVTDTAVDESWLLCSINLKDTIKIKFEDISGYDEPLYYIGRQYGVHAVLYCHLGTKLSHCFIGVE